MVLFCILRLTDVDAFTPWSFEVFVLGLDIILPKMKEENFMVLDSAGKGLIIDPSTGYAFLDVGAKNVRTSDPANPSFTARADLGIDYLFSLLHP